MVIEFKERVHKLETGLAVLVESMKARDKKLDKLSAAIHRHSNIIQERIVKEAEDKVKAEKRWSEIENTLKRLQLKFGAAATAFIGTLGFTFYRFIGHLFDKIIH